MGEKKRKKLAESQKIQEVIGDSSTSEKEPGYNLLTLKEILIETKTKPSPKNGKIESGVDKISELPVNNEVYQSDNSIMKLTGNLNQDPSPVEIVEVTEKNQLETSGLTKNMNRFCLVPGIKNSISRIPKVEKTKSIQDGVRSASSSVYYEFPDFNYVFMKYCDEVHINVDRRASYHSFMRNCRHFNGTNTENICVKCISRIKNSIALMMRNNSTQRVCHRCTIPNCNILDITPFIGLVIRTKIKKSRSFYDILNIVQSKHGIYDIEFSINGVFSYHEEKWLRPGLHLNNLLENDIRVLTISYGVVNNTKNIYTIKKTVILTINDTAKIIILINKREITQLKVSATGHQNLLSKNTTNILQNDFIIRIEFTD